MAFISIVNHWTPLVAFSIYVWFWLFLNTRKEQCISYFLLFSYFPYHFYVLYVLYLITTCNYSRSNSILFPFLHDGHVSVIIILQRQGSRRSKIFFKKCWKLLFWQIKEIAKKPFYSNHLQSTTTNSCPLSMTAIRGSTLIT